MPQSSPESTVPPTLKRGLIRRVLEPALQLWLKSQAESVSSLQVQLAGGDRQILSGYLPTVQLQATQVIYQGLHLSHLVLKGHNLRINIGQVLKGKPLQLLEPLPIDLEVSIQAADAQACLDSVLFQGAIIEALQTLVGPQIADILGQDASRQNLTLHHPLLTLSEHRLRFSAVLRDDRGDRTVPVALQTTLLVNSPQTLTLQQPEWLPTPQSKRGLPLHDLQGYTFDLGPQVQLHTLSITPEAIFLQGQITVLTDASQTQDLEEQTESRQ